MENPISMDPTFVSPQIVMLATAMQAKKEKPIPSLGISFSQNNIIVCQRMVLYQDSVLVSVVGSLDTQ